MAKQQKPAIKNSFYSLYKETIDIILLCLGVVVGGVAISLLLVYFIIYMPKLIYITCLIIISILVLKLIKDNFFYVAYLLNQRRIPLLSTELQQLGINSVEEYANYTKKLLHGYPPRKDIWIKIVINTYNCFFKDNNLDEFIIVRPDENGYGFHSNDIFMKRKDYNLIQQAYKKGQKLDEDFLTKMNQKGIDMYNALLVSPIKFKEERIIGFYDLFDADFDIKDEIKVALIKNKVEFKDDNKYFYTKCYYKLMFENTWFYEIEKNI